MDTFFDDIGLGDAYDIHFHNPAHKFIMGKEPFSIPRLKFGNESSIRRIYTEDEIKDGFKPFYTRFGQKLNANLKPLSVKSFQYHIKLKDSSRRKHWLFWSYPDTSLVKWLHFDFDRHYSLISDSDKIEESFYNQITRFVSVCNTLNVPITWVTSPGDVHNEKHIQGLYAYIFLKTPIEVKNLREVINKFKQFYGIKAEHSFDKTHRLIRLPGQRYVELCDIDICHTEKRVFIKHRDVVKDKENISDNKARYLMFLNHLRKVQQIDTNILSTSNSENKSSIVEENKNYRSSKITFNHGLFNSKIKDTYSQDQINDFLSTYDTWMVKKQSKVHSLLVHKYKGDATKINDAVFEADDFFQCSRPEESRTRTNGIKFHYRCLKHMFDKFDIKKCTGHIQKEIDKQNISHMSNIDSDYIIQNILRLDYKFNKSEIKKIILIINSIKEFNGRVSYKIFRKILGMNLYNKVKLLNVFSIVQKHEKDIRDPDKKGKCRQWSLSLKFIKRYKERSKYNNNQPKKAKKKESISATETRLVNIENTLYDVDVCFLEEKEHEPVFISLTKEEFSFI